MKHIIAGTLFFFFTLVTMHGQQNAQYSLYMLNKFAFNPAYAGLDHSLSLTGVYRGQWVGLEGNPSTAQVNVHMPLYILRGGLGLSFENDELGARQGTQFTLAYNYQLELGDGILSIGVAGGLRQLRLNGNDLRTPQGEYEDGTVINHQDELLPITSINGSTPIFDAGAFYQNDWLEIGVASKNLSEPGIELENLTYQLVRNYIVYGGAYFDITGSIQLQPSFMVRSDLTQTQTDLSLLVQYNNNIFVGATFRGYSSETIDALGIIGGLKISENITLGYAHDLGLSDLQLVNDGSHEIMLNYNLNKRIGAGRPPNIIYNPRAL